MKHVLIVGAGLTGAALARTLAEAGHRVTVIEERDHVAGNCHTKADPDTGITLHVYGPHIFHTDKEHVWSFVNRFSSFKPYIQRTKTVSQGRVFSLPLNLLTINQFFGLALSPAEAANFIASQADKTITEPADFEEQALAFLGEKLYKAFFHGYTKKQWGCEPKELPASVLKRLPVRFNYDDNYFNHPHQGLPEHGYTRLAENMLDHPAVEVRLGRSYTPSMKIEFDHVFHSGSLDRYFEYQYGRLPYRTLDFEWFTESGDHQGCPVMNYADQDVPYTRVVEHKHFSYWERHEATVCNREIPRACGVGDTPYYPIRFATATPGLENYLRLAKAEKNVTFVGRLGAFRYLDMDQALDEALAAAGSFIAANG